MLETDSHAKRQVLRRWVKISGVALLLAFLALLVSAGITSREVRAVESATAFRAQLFRYDLNLQSVLSLLTDAETGQRGYLLTGRDSYLAPYRNALLRVPPTLDSLEPAPLSDPRLIGHVRTIRQLANGKLAELAQTIRLRDAGDSNAALSLVRSDVGERSMEQVRREVSMAVALGQAAIDASDRQVVEATIRGQRLVGLTLGALLICGLFAALQMGSLWMAQGRYEVALSTSERLHRAIVEDQTELIAISSLMAAWSLSIPPMPSSSSFRPLSSRDGRSMIFSRRRSARSGSREWRGYSKATTVCCGCSGWRGAAGWGHAGFRGGTGRSAPPAVKSGFTLLAGISRSTRRRNSSCRIARIS